MSFWTRISGDQLRAAVRINFYGSENSASVELAPEPIDEASMLIHINLFLSYYARMACDLTSEQFEVLKVCMDVAGKNILALELGCLPAGKVSTLDSQMHLQPITNFGITRTHTCELYEKKNGIIFPQSKWSPAGIGKFGPFSMLYYYQALIDCLPIKIQGFLATRVKNMHNYFLITGGKPNIAQIGEAVKYAITNQ